MKGQQLLVLVFFNVFLLAFADQKQTASGEKKDSSESTELTSGESDLFVSLVKKLVQAGYAGHKGDLIEGLVSKLKEEKISNNVTLVGSQNIYDKAGNLKEIRTIELSIPTIEQKNSTNANEKSEDDEFDLTDLEEMRELRELVHDMSILGVDMDVAYTEQDQLGNIESLFYLNKDIMAFKTEGLLFVNKTIHMDTIEEVQADYKQYSKNGTLPETILMFNKEGKFLMDKSTIQPEHLVSVEADWEQPSAEMINITMTSLAEKFLTAESRDDVPEGLRLALQSYYPDLTFTVTSGEADGSFMYKDFSIHLNYDFVDFEDSIKYSVYGYNATTSA